MPDMVSGPDVSRFDLGGFVAQLGFEASRFEPFSRDRLCNIDLRMPDGEHLFIVATNNEGFYVEHYTQEGHSVDYTTMGDALTLAAFIFEFAKAHGWVPPEVT